MGRKIPALGLALLAGAACLGGEAAAQAWELTWSDEFEGPSNTLPDAAKWNVEVVANPANNEAQYYSDRTENVSLNGKGQLELTAYKEPAGNKQYTSGRINTGGKFTQAYGRWEARMKLPAGVGMWPAFWILGTNNGCGGWPNCGEIDWMENRGRQPTVSSSAMHGPGYSGNTPLVHAQTLPSGAPDLFSGFHDFAGEWYEGQVRFFVDGNLHYTVNKADVQKYGNWVYDHPFYTILNLAIGGNFDGGQLPPDAAFPAKLTVEYVKVYKGAVGIAIRPLTRSAPGRGFAGTDHDASGRRLPVTGRGKQALQRVFSF